MAYLKSINKNSVAIVGGGIAGLSTAYYFSKLTSFRPVIFEATDSLGGLAGTQNIRIAGRSIKIEKFYHHFFAKDKYLRELLKELGLETSLVFRGVKNNYGPKKYNMCSIIVLVAATIVPWQILANIPIKFWYKFCNKKLDYLQQLLKKKFGSHYLDLNTAWLWARIHARFTLRDILTEKLGVIEPSIDVLITALKRKIISANGQILLRHPVYHINTLCKQGYRNIVYTAGLNNFNRFVRHTGIKINAPQYLGAFNIVLITQKPLTNYYWDQEFILNQNKLPLLVKVEQSLLNRSLPKNIVYLGGYAVPSQIDYIQKNKVSILRTFLSKLQINKVEFADIFTTKIAQHAPTVAYVKYMPKDMYKFKDCRLFLATFGNVMPWDRGVNTAIAQAKKLVEKYFLL